ncbi:ER lumen protein-retaining receptor-like [Toxorhynchites rutilus septentrionalis]|uniref:ER lumen protein-retaining receptor-like n=1 Tax=Toxorhynchites rutilus septentrionalis TaxID=329112 RepID=UPI00247A2E17|nr:ER lumen protein-retaining receptor-like [Toxorhynchites rutilus septentrionalis]
MMNIFRILGDSLHALALILLIAKLWRTKSCAGLSGKTQILSAIIYTTRYADLLSPNHYHSYYVSSMKIAFIAVSCLTVYLIYGPYKKTYDRENDDFYNEFLIVPCFVLSLFSANYMSPLEIMWTFSIFLEAVAILPQLDLLCHVKFVDSYTVCYLLSLGLYRALYILNWAYRYYYEGDYDLIAVGSGFLQTALFSLVFVRIYMLKRREDSVMISVVT